MERLREELWINFSRRWFFDILGKSQEREHGRYECSFLCHFQGLIKGIPKQPEIDRPYHRYNLDRSMSYLMMSQFRTQLPSTTQTLTILIHFLNS